MAKLAMDHAPLRRRRPLVRPRRTARAGRRLGRLGARHAGPGARGFRRRLAALRASAGELRFQRAGHLSLRRAALDRRAGGRQAALDPPRAGPWRHHHVRHRLSGPDRRRRRPAPGRAPAAGAALGVQLPQGPCLGQRHHHRPDARQPEQRWLAVAGPIDIQAPVCSLGVLASDGRAAERRAPICAPIPADAAVWAERLEASGSEGAQARGALAWRWAPARCAGTTTARPRPSARPCRRPWPRRLPM